MATTLTCQRIEPVLNLLYSDTKFGAFNPSVTLTTDLKDTLANGTAIDNANLIHTSRYTITNSSTPQSIDLSGALTDVFGNAVVFAKVTTLLVKNRSTTAAEILTVGGGATPFSAWLGAADAEGVKVGPDGFLFIHNPSLAAYAVGAGASDLLQVATASGTNVQFDLWVIGRSA